jgi:hypothetical protein
VRFFLDNNLSPYLARALNALSEPGGDEVRHIADSRFARNTPDVVWIDALAKEGDWCIVTQDRLTKNPHEKEALRRSGLTTFVLSKGWSSFKEWHKAWLLVRWWPVIIQQAGLVSGGVFEVPVKFSGKGRLKAVKL